MVRDIAYWIRGGLSQNPIPIIGGSGEPNRGIIGVLVQSKVNLANRSQDKGRHPLIVTTLHFVNDLVPECAELVLQFR